MCTVSTEHTGAAVLYATEQPWLYSVPTPTLTHTPNELGKVYKSSSGVNSENLRSASAQDCTLEITHYVLLHCKK